MTKIERVAEMKAAWERHFFSSYAKDLEVKDNHDTGIFHKGYCTGVIHAMSWLFDEWKDESELKPLQ